MAATECSFCHGALANAGKVRYCPQCGWNKQEAISQLRLSMRMFPFAFLATLGFTYFIFRNFTHSRGFDIALAILLPAFAFALGFLFLRLGLTKVEGAPDFDGRAATAAAVREPSATSQKSRDPVQESEAAALDRALFKISRPREVRWNARGKKKVAFTVVYVVVGAGLVSYSVYQEWAPTHSFAGLGANQLVLAAVVALVVGLVASTWRATARDRNLLENGELVLARVVKKWAVRWGETIYCEYQDAQGQWRKISALDNSHTLEIGMVTPVFYDPANPKRQVIYRAARFDVVNSN